MSEMSDDHFSGQLAMALQGSPPGAGKQECLAISEAADCENCRHELSHSCVVCRDE